MLRLLNSGQGGLNGRSQPAVTAPIAHIQWSAPSVAISSEATVTGNNQPQTSHSKVWNNALMGGDDKDGRPRVGSADKSRRWAEQSRLYGQIAE